MLVLLSQSRLLGSNPIVWLCDQEPVKSFQIPRTNKGPPPEVRKSHCHVFLGGLDPGQAPLKTLLLMLRLT